jgi:PAS domain S-box-containing protein
MFVHNSAAPIRSKAGEILGSAVAIMDITDQQMMKKNLEKTVERLNIISTTASELLFSSQPQEIVETLCRKVMEHLDCDVFFNFLVDEQMNCLRLNAYEGIPEEIARQIHLLDYGVAVCGCAAKDACRIVAENIPTTPDVRTDLVRSFGITAYACHPLLARGAVIGTLSFGTKSRFTFTEDELSLMKTVADQVATAMERIRLLEVEKNRASDLEQTVEKRTTQLRRQAELLDLSHDAIFLRDNEGRISYWNEGAEDTYGFTRDEAIGNTIQDLLKTKAEIPIQDIVDTVKHNGRWEGELTHVGKNGQEVTVHSRWALRVNEAGGPYEIMEVNRDITLRKQAENALRESEERYRVAIESASDGIALVKKDFHVFVNRRFAEIFGYDDPLEIIEKPLSLTVHPDDLDMVSEINLMRQMGEPVPSRYEFKGIKKDGSLRIMEVSAARTNYRGEPVSLAYLRDITDYKNLHDQLRQSQKMEAIGTLAGGIAHDFNNILAAIMGFAEMIEEDIPLGKPKVEHVQRVIHAASRGKELVQQILAFSRKAEYARYPVSLSAIAKETSQLLRASIPTTIDIILDLTATSDTILATPVEVQQILMNLVANAAHSMREKGGILHISIKDMYIDSQSPVLEGEMVPGEYAELVVSDTGTGMARDLMERIFEPFFTTREVGQGTGMGLAVVYGIVKGLHGSIRVESEPGVGSTFTIFFPKARVDLVANQPVSEQTQGNGERVLFVDDEEFLTEWGKDILERLGYEVMATNDSVEAFEAFTYDPSLFDVVVTDQTMPGLTGLQLARECLRVRPDIPIILCTGHSDSITPDTLKEGGIRELLMKPLVRKELAQAIHRVLNKDEEL